MTTTTLTIHNSRFINIFQNKTYTYKVYIHFSLTVLKKLIRFVKTKQRNKLSNMTTQKQRYSL